MKEDTVNLKDRCLSLISEYDSCIRLLFDKIKPDLLAHVRIKNPTFEHIDVDDVTIDSIGIHFKVSGTPWYDKALFFLPWTHFNIKR